MRMSVGLCCGVVLMIAFACAPDAQKRAPAVEEMPPGVRYIAALQQGIGRAREQMPAIMASAEGAAERVLAGGKLYAGGSQGDFAAELIGRAGGLMCIQPGDANAGVKDVVLYAARSSLTDDDRLQISRMRQAGALVIIFASKSATADATIDCGAQRGLPLRINKICPMDSVINILNAWTWTGEFISACTRQGKMPVVWKSIHLDGGQERAAKYKGKTFHDDMEIDPIKPGVLGAQYLQAMARSLSALRSEAPEAEHFAAAKLREATPARSVLLLTGHMFPEHYKDVRAPQPFGTMDRLDPNPATPPPPGQMLVVLGYQKAPQLAIDSAHVNHDVLLYASVQRGRDDKAPFIRYVDPHFPMEDACVPIKGYDVPALPASGVMQAAIFWSLLAETYPPGAAAR